MLLFLLVYYYYNVFIIISLRVSGFRDRNIAGLTSIPPIDLKVGCRRGIGFVVMNAAHSPGVFLVIRSASGDGVAPRWRRANSDSDAWGGIALKVDAVK